MGKILDLINHSKKTLVGLSMTRVPRNKEAVK
jgi:hypothetical protein